MITKYKQYKPEIHPSVFIADSADIIGKVHLHRDSSIWFHAVLRADSGDIVVGEGSNIQDLVCVHESESTPTIIGRFVTIGHSAIIHGCEIDDYSLIGMGSTILDGSKIGKYCIIGANSMVPKGMVIPDGKLCYGSPAKIIRDVTDEEKHLIEKNALEYISKAKDFMEDER